MATMLSSSFYSSSLQNIPISLSLLHDEEYHNICLLLKKDSSEKRRAYSETNVHRHIQKNKVKHPVVTCKG